MMLASGVGGRVATARLCSKISTSLSNHCCSGKTITITYSERVSVALIIHYASASAVLYCYYVVSLVFQIFPRHLTTYCIAAC